ncbi:hypothetical protein [Lutimonas zeaxanthinifaciens]|uniref:hypothetical protein n=1 Tax=Lutimonas zeaxanthinifaciens TaxID=3060215 RepID=UPI00265D1160|nr:hypothetical protein [Lutimonas sp. YSD2104]WKK65899.1 hypothetical protein QZH61_15085 [Lutimonas sp. YSD2104]
MIKNLFLLFFLLSCISICAQNDKGIKEISIYKTPVVNYDLKGSLHSKIRSVSLNGETNYYLDINEGRVYCTIRYENLETLISGIKRLEAKALLDERRQEDGVKSIVMTPYGFVVGYYMNKGKAKRFFGFGEVNEIGEDINRQFSTYEENFESFNMEKETYGTYKAKLTDFKIGIDFFSAVKERIEEIKKSEGELIM